MAESGGRFGGGKKERPEDIKSKRDLVLARYQAFKTTSQQRRGKLEQAKQLQQFHRDADGLEAWIIDKIRIASDESYKDRRNLLGKIQKHQAFEAEIAAHTNSIIEVKDKGRKMIDQKHFAGDKIRTRLDEIASAWQRLLAMSADKRQKLQDAQKREQFVREADEVSAWITDKIAIASSDESGKDLEHVELLQKKFDEFFKDIQGNEGRITSTNQLAQKLLSEGHPDSELIISKQKFVNESWRELKELAHLRREKLEGAHEVQTFNRAIEETATWMNEKATAVQSDDYGRDLDSVQALQRKHEGLERDLDALEIKVQEVGEESEKLRSLHPGSTDQIAAKQAEISMLWETLKHKASKRGSKLEDAQKFQKFVADDRDLVSWVNDMKRVIEADELAKDLSGANALLQRHKERKGEIDAQEDSFKTTIQFGQSLISLGHFASEEVKQKLVLLAEEKSKLLSLWEERKKEFEQCNEFMIFLRDVEQAENWVVKQESVMSSEEEGDSLESVEGLLKKHENYQKSLATQEEKFKAIDESAEVMIASEHYASNEITSKRKAVLSQHKELLELADKRYARLHDCFQLQQFLRDSEEITMWISDKKKIASDETYKDSSNLEAKMQQHHTSEGELQANRHRMESVVDAGRELLSAEHFAADRIRSVCQGLQDIWSQLETISTDKGQKLQQAHDQQQFNRAVKDMEIWLDEVDKQLRAEELGKDLAGVKKLQKKLALLEADITVHKDQIDSLNSQGKQLVADNHFDAVAIQQKKKALLLRYQDLQEPLSTQKNRLEASFQLQQFLRDIDDEEVWIKDREPFAALPNRGTDLVGVQNLQKKHNILMNEIANHESRINVVLKEGEKMITEGHYGEEEIQTKITELQHHWQNLKDTAEARKQLLADSYEDQLYFTDALEAELWMKDMEPVVRSSDYGKDEDMAEALLKKHEVVLADVESFDATIKLLGEQSEKCKDISSTISDAGSTVSDKHYVKALFNYKPQSPREIVMKKGEVLTVINSSTKEWWKVATSSGSVGFVPANYLKTISSTSIKHSVGRKPSFNISLEVGPQESVSERQAAIRRKYKNLQHQARERKQRLEESKIRFAQSREMNELQHWIYDKATFVNSEEVGKDLEHVEALKKKFEAFQKELPVSESKLISINSLAERMVQEGHTDAEDIQSEMEELNQQWESLMQSISARKQQLEGAYDVQKFNRAADETKLWMNEKSTAVQSDDYGRDLASVQGLQRKHEGLERDLDALEEKVKSLSVEAGALCRTQPKSAKIVKAKEKEFLDAWSSLKAKSETHKNKLVDSHDLQKFLSDYRDLMTWVSSIQALISSQEVASDVEGAETLLNRHKELKNEIEAKKAGIQAFSTFGKQLLVQNHYASSTIRENLNTLASEIPTLDKAWTNRKVLLDQCLDLQLFSHDCEQAESWMAKKEAFLFSEEMTLGTSLDTVEALIRKHEDFDKSLQGQEVKIAELQKFADRLVQGRHYAAVEIAERRASVLARWAKLKESVLDWRSRLGQSQSLQQFNRDADEVDAWITEKMGTATDESYRDPINLQSKLKKHEAFQAEVVANKVRVYGIIEAGKELIESQKCPGREKDVETRITLLEEQWAALNSRSAEKSQKLTEANQEQQFNETIKDLDFWLQEIEAKLTADELGHDLGSIDVLLKKQQLQEADIKAHEDHIKELNTQALKFVESNHFDAKSIQAKQANIDTRYARLQELAAGRKAKLQDSLKLQQFYASIHEEQAWIKEKNLLVSSTDYGKDLFGVRKHKKNHQQLENELDRHEQTMKGLLAHGDDLALSDHYAQRDIKLKCEQLQKQWQELNTLSSARDKKLDESLSYHEFCALVSEEEAWLSEKISVQQSEDFGDSLAAVQSLLKKHETFETDLTIHEDRVQQMEKDGTILLEQHNYQADKIKHRLTNMKQKLADLEKATAKRKMGLYDSEACLQFYWETDTVESWIKSKQGQLHGEDYGRDVGSVQTLLSKHETFESGLVAYKKDGIEDLTSKKEKLLSDNHTQSRSILQRYNDVMRKWEKLQKDSEIHKSRLQRSLDQFKKVEELFVQFAKKASAFSTTLTNIEEDLVDPVRCNTLDEIQSLRSANTQLQQAITQAKNDFKQIATLDRQIKSYSASSSNPYTWFTLESLDESMQNMTKLMKEREAELHKELQRQQENEDTRKIFATQANSFHTWLSETRTALVVSTGTCTLESQLEMVLRKSDEIKMKKDSLKHIEELGAKVEEALIFDNKYTEHTPVSLGQQWDQSRQMVMRIQHNLEQQIQARKLTGVSEEQLREFSSNFKHFDKDQNGKLEHHEFKACLRSLGYEFPVLEQGQTDPKFEHILDQVDPNRRGHTTFEDYMTFMISKETDNIQSIAEVEEAFRAIAANRDKPYVTKEELLQVLSRDQVEYCIKKMKLYKDSTGSELRDVYDYKDFAQSLF